MNAAVLGTGESIALYNKEEKLTIGVNDIFKFHSVDHLLCLDKKCAFTSKRLKVIENSTPKFFYSHIIEWATSFDQFVKINLARVRGSLEDFDTEYYCYHNNSIFVASILAYKLGATRIIIYGADFRTHKELAQDRSQQAIIKSFLDLSNRLKTKDVELLVASKYSILSEVLEQPC